MWDIRHACPAKLVWPRPKHEKKYRTLVRRIRISELYIITFDNIESTMWYCYGGYCSVKWILIQRILFNKINNILSNDEFNCLYFAKLFCIFLRAAFLLPLGNDVRCPTGYINRYASQTPTRASGQIWKSMTSWAVSPSPIPRASKGPGAISCNYCGILIFSYGYSLDGAKSHSEHLRTWLGIDHLEVSAYLWQSTGVSLCSDKMIGQGRGAEAGVIAVTAPSWPMRGQLGSI